MINFRYHLVSIAAILIALAAGIALGSGPLDDAGSSLRGDEPRTTEVDPAMASFESGYAGRTADGLLGDKLKGQNVVVLTVPGTSAADVRGITQDVEKAGGQVTGQVAFTAKMLDASGRQFAEGVAQEAAGDVAGVTSDGDSYGRIGAAISRSILGDKVAPADQTAETIRTAFTEADLISVPAAPKKLATVAVLVTGPQRAGESDQSTVLAALVAALNNGGKGVVVAGPTSSSRDGGAVKAVRDGDAASEISTVDVTESPAGRVLTALALARQVAGQPGAWGTSRSADGALPK